MTYIHQNKGWPEFSWNAAALTTTLARVRHRQGQLLGGMATLGFDLRTETSLEMLTRDVVKSSAIEGVALDEGEVRSSIASRLGLQVAGLPKVGREVDGVVAMMLDATQRFEVPLTRDRLFGWHASLFPTSRSTMRRITVGSWRLKEAGAMQVVSGPIGRERVHFEAPEAERLEAEMARFIAWFNAPTLVDPVLKAGVAHLWFVTVHPFEDGNGRIARAIADMALARADGTKDRFYSLSSQIAVERKAYYQVLEAAQRGGMDITTWLEWFLACLDRALQNSRAAVSTVLNKAGFWQRIDRYPVNDRQRRVINRLLNGFQEHLTNAKYAKLAKCSSDTALRDIRALLACGVLAKNPGGGRSTSYRLTGTDTLP